MFIAALKTSRSVLRLETSGRVQQVKVCSDVFTVRESESLSRVPIEVFWAVSCTAKLVELVVVLVNG